MLSNALCVDVLSSTAEGSSTASVSAFARVGHSPRNTVDHDEEANCNFLGGTDCFQDSPKSAEDCMKTENGETDDKLEKFLLDDNFEYLSDIKMELSDDDSAGK